MVAVAMGRVHPSEAVAADFREAFPDLFGRARTVAHRVLGDPALAEEVAQETMVRTYERWDQVSRHPRPVGWVLDAAWKVSMEAVRHRGRRFPIRLRARDWVPAADADVGRPMLYDAIRALTDRQRSVFLARYLFGHDVAETAVLLGMSAQQVKDASREARDRLRNQLEPFREDLLS